MHLRYITPIPSLNGEKCGNARIMFWCVYVVWNPFRGNKKANLTESRMLEWSWLLLTTVLPTKPTQLNNPSVATGNMRFMY